MPELNTRIALVTGASRGIGKAIALALANAGAGIAVNYRERAEEATSVVEAVHRIGGRAVAIGADVSIASSVKNMVATIEEQLASREAPYSESNLLFLPRTSPSQRACGYSQFC